MATSILVSPFRIGVAAHRFDSAVIPRRHHLRGSNGSAATLRRTALSLNSSVAREHDLGFGRNNAVSQWRRRRLLKAQENDEGGVEDPKPFYSTVEFWIQAAVVFVTVGFVDAGYSRDWSRIGAISQETEAQLRIGAYLVVPLSAVLVWVIGKRRNPL